MRLVLFVLSRKEQTHGMLRLLFWNEYSPFGLSMWLYHVSVKGWSRNKKQSQQCYVEKC